MTLPEQANQTKLILTLRKSPESVIRLSLCPADAAHQVISSTGTMRTPEELEGMLDISKSVLPRPNPPNDSIWDC